MKYYGVGINDLKGLCNTDGKDHKDYKLWCDMLRRCYAKESVNKSYKGVVTVCDDWKTFSNFRRDVESMECFGNAGFVLDKDLLIKYNTQYSKEACCFIPSEINTTLNSRKSYRSNMMVGVRIRNGKFRAYCSFKNKMNYLGVYETEHEAFMAYKSFKETCIKSLAVEYKHIISEKVFNALMVYEVCCED